MTYDPSIHRRRSIRLREYDYTQPGMYFITACTLNRNPLFGQVANGKMRLNQFGRVVQEEWLRTAELRPKIEPDAFVIMPNHMHGILVIIGDPSIDGEPPATRATEPVDPTATKRPPRLKSQSIGAIVGQFKSVAAKRINAVRGTPGASVWQRNYYKHIIGSDRSLDRLRDYIEANPALWDRDSLYMPYLGRQ